MKKENGIVNLGETVETFSAYFRNRIKYIFPRFSVLRSPF